MQILTETSSASSKMKLIRVGRPEGKVTVQWLPAKTVEQTSSYKCEDPRGDTLGALNDDEDAQRAFHYRTAWAKAPVLYRGVQVRSGVHRFRSNAKLLEWMIEHITLKTLTKLQKISQ
jgi:hypothetical protein